MGDDPGGETGPCDGRRLDDSLLEVPQPVDPRVDEPANAVGTPGCHVLDAGRQLPLAVLLEQKAFSYEVVDEGGDEQRVASGRPVYRRCEVERKPVAGEALREVSVDRVHAEVVEKDRRCLTVGDELARHLPDRVVTRNLGGSIPAGQEESRPLSAASGGSHAPRPPRVRPLQLLEYDDHPRVAAPPIPCLP